MRLSGRAVSVWMLLGLVWLNGTAWAVSASKNSLYADLSRAGTVAIHVAEPVDKSKEPKADLPGLKAALEKALTERKSVRFAVQPVETGARLRVNAEVTETIWLKDDPIDMLMGVGGTAMDAAVVEHYARMQAVFTVTDVKSGRALWSEDLKATITSNDVTEANFKQKINERMAEVFVIAAFGKTRR